MNRRGFLQAMLAAGMAPAIVKAANIMPMFVRRESGLFVPSGMDLIRETLEYDIGRGIQLVRFDVLVGSTQLCVDARIGSKDAEALPNLRQLARKLFDDGIRHHGLSWDQARPLQKPVQIVKAP